jgi:orotate phosphoribosyltransferase
MHLVPTPEEVLTLVHQTGALRSGHFEYRNGLHSDQHLELPLAMRYHGCAKTLSVGLSRLLRANPEIRRVIPELSVVAATVGGLPVAHGLCEALRARQVYWAEKTSPDSRMCFPQYLEQKPGEKVLLVDDILRSGKLLHEAKALVESKGGEVVGLAVLLYQPTPKTMGFGDLPLYYLARLHASYYTDAANCELCKRGIPLENVEIGDETEEARDVLLALGA